MNASATLTSDFSYAETAEPAAAPHPLTSLARLMRGRWLLSATVAAGLGGGLAAAGYLSGHPLFESQAILRLYPQEANILYRTNDDSVLKTFDSFAKAETSTVASHPVMSRAIETLPAEFAHLTENMTVGDLGGSIEIKRSDSLIVLTTKSKDPGFASAKLTAVINAYLALQAENETQRSDVRLAELLGRETSLLARRDEIRLQTLEVGGEFGIAALAKAHVEKVTQIESLASRKAEVEATLEAMKTATGTSSADMQDDEIMRATLLDRALADLNFERAKREAELSTLQTRYSENSRALRDKREELAVIDRAMAARREQIKVLGQTGALTDTTNATPESSIAEIQALLQKVTGQLDLARQEARDLNAKRATLASLEEDAEENRALLDETRAALEVIRLEAGRALPGYSVVMSPASTPTKPVADSRKTNAAAGLGLGVFLAFAGALVAGIAGRQLRHSDALGRVASRVPVMLVTKNTTPSAPEMDRLRNTIKLRPLRAPRHDITAQIIALAPIAKDTATDSAQALGASFARSGLKTLVIDSGFGVASKSDGWREALVGRDVQPKAVGDNLFQMPNGRDPHVTCGTIGTAQLRRALAKLAAEHDVIVLGCGSLEQTVSTELVLGESDFALACLTPADAKATVSALIQRFDILPRQGGAVLFTSAQSNDPGLTH